VSATARNRTEDKSELDELKQRLCTFERRSDFRVYQDPRGEMILVRMSLQSVHHGSEFPLFPSHHFLSLNGVLPFLGKTSNGNPHDKGMVLAFAEYAHDNTATHSPKNAADIDSDSYFFSKNEVNQHMGYYFKNMKVTPTHYALQSSCDGVGGTHPQTWVIESSEDRLTWFEIDSQRNTTALDGPRRIGVFQVKEIQEARFIRIRQTGRNRAGNNHLYFTAFERFGCLQMME
jgi:hypothetical protein